jgi:hypothetical protein
MTHDLRRHAVMAMRCVLVVVAACASPSAPSPSVRRLARDGGCPAITAASVSSAHSLLPTRRTVHIAGAVGKRAASDRAVCGRAP